MPRVYFRNSTLVSVKFAILVEELRGSRTFPDPVKKTLQCVVNEVLRDDPELYIKIYAKSFSIAVDACIMANAGAVQAAKEMGFEVPENLNEDELLKHARSEEAVTRDLHDGLLPSLDESWSILIDASKKLKATGIFQYDFTDKESGFIEKMKKLLCYQ